jgi:hypothetical protein
MSNEFRRAPDDVEWRTIADFPRYSVSARGHVRRDAKARGARAGHLLRHGLSHGYPVVLLRRDGHKAVLSVHSLVAKAFIGPIANGRCVNHKNGIKEDNSIENLEIISPAQNCAHAASTGLSASGERHGMSRLTRVSVAEIRAARAMGAKLADIAAAHGVGVPCVSQICSGKSWRTV